MSMDHPNPPYCYKCHGLITCRYWRCDIKGADAGLLVGKTVAVKDNVAVAGIPMMFGSKMMEGYTPEYDATIVTRILEQGQNVCHCFIL